jgi:hypothetical protein
MLSNWPFTRKPTEMARGIGSDISELCFSDTTFAADMKDM